LAVLLDGCHDMAPGVIRAITHTLHYRPAQPRRTGGCLCTQSYAAQHRFTSSVAASLVVASSVGPASSWGGPGFFAASKLPPGTSDIQLGQERSAIDQDPERRS
jgi:hypothetical protein